MVRRARHRAQARAAMKRIPARVLRRRLVRLCALWMAYSETYTERARRARVRKDIKTVRALEVCAYLYRKSAKQLAATVLAPWR